MADPPKLLNRQQSEQLLQLEDDLRSLLKFVMPNRKEPLTEADVRLASVILRKWLIDGLLGELCRSIGAQPTFDVLDNSTVIDALRAAAPVDFFLTGGIRFNGLGVSGVYESRTAFTGTPVLPVTTMKLHEVGIGAFLDQNRIYYHGTFLTAAEIIKFCANKLGGAHYDLNREGKAALLDEVYTLMMFGGPLRDGEEPSGQIYLPIQPKPCPVLSGLHIEVVAAAISLVEVRLNGTPLLQIEKRESWRSRIRQFFGLHHDRAHVFEIEEE